MKLVKQLSLLESNHRYHAPEFDDLAKDLGLKVELLSDGRLIAYFIKRGIKCPVLFFDPNKPSVLGINPSLTESILLHDYSTFQHYLKPDRIVQESFGLYWIYSDYKFTDLAPQLYPLLTTIKNVYLTLEEILSSFKSVLQDKLTVSIDEELPFRCLNFQLLIKSKTTGKSVNKVTIDLNATPDFGKNALIRQIIFSCQDCKRGQLFVATNLFTDSILKAKVLNAFPNANHPYGGCLSNNCYLRLSFTPALRVKQLQPLLKLLKQ